MLGIEELFKTLTLCGIECRKVPGLRGEIQEVSHAEASRGEESLKGRKTVPELRDHVIKDLPRSSTHVY